MTASSDSKYERKKAEFEAAQAAKRIERRRKQEAEEKAEKAWRAAELAAAAEKWRVEVAIHVEKKKKDTMGKSAGRRRKTGRVVSLESESASKIGVTLNSDEEESKEKCTVCIKRNVPCIWNKVSIAWTCLPFFGVNSGLQTGKLRSCISCQEMKLRCRTKVNDDPVRKSVKRKVKEDEGASVTPKCQKTAGVKNPEPEGRAGGRDVEAYSDHTLWGNSIKAVKWVRNWMSELTGVLGGIRGELGEIAKATRASDQTQKQLLEEVWKLIWVQDQTRGMVHVVAKRLERLDGVVEVSESELEGSRVARKKQDKGKGKEVVDEDKEAEKSDKSEELEKSGESEVEDVVKGPEISTLDVDESMEVEK